MAAAPPKPLSLITDASVTALNGGNMVSCKLAKEIDEFGLGTTNAHSIEITSCDLHNGHIITLDQPSAQGELCLPYAKRDHALEAAPPITSHSWERGPHAHTDARPF